MKQIYRLCFVIGLVLVTVPFGMAVHSFSKFLAGHPSDSSAIDTIMTRLGYAWISLPVGGVLLVTGLVLFCVARSRTRAVGH